MSKNFYIVLTLVLGTYAAAQSWTYTTHLEAEMVWSADLLEQNTHSLTVIGYQKDALEEASRLIDHQNNYIEALENKLFSLLGLQAHE